MESWGPGIIPDKWGDVNHGGESSNSRDSKEDGGEGGPWFLVLYEEEWAAVFQAEGDPIPGNSQRCDARHKFPRRR